MVYTKTGCERIIRFAYEYAQQKGHTEILSVDKANMLSCSQFWRQIYHDIGNEYPNLKKGNFYVDAFCQWLVRKTLYSSDCCDGKYVWRYRKR